MRVVLAAGKRGHYYLTARALREQGVLARFITSTFFPERSWRRRLYPPRRVAVRSDRELSGAPVVSLWPIELGYRATCALAGRRQALERAYNRLFDLASIPFARGLGEILHVANTYARHSAPAARRAGMKVVIDQQSVHPRYWQAAGLPGDRSTDRQIEEELAHADLILVPSRFVYDQNLAAGIPATRQRLVPIGVDTDLFTPIRPDSPDSPAPQARSGPPVVLSVGTLGKSKGTDTLLEAARRLRGRIRLRLIGSVRPEMRLPLAEARGWIEHLPPMPQRALAEQYRAADLFCLPSLAEGSALVVYEALASGLPCVVTPAAGSVVTHGGEGLVVPPSDPEALASALEHLAREPSQRETMSTRARAIACQCDLASYGKRLLSAYVT